jgi:hypothetical protein
MKPQPIHRIREAPDLDVVFPQPEEPLKEHRRPVSWLQCMREMEPQLRYYLEHYDSPEKRLAEKSPTRFTL